MKCESQHPELISGGKGKPFKKSISLGTLGLGKLWRRRSVTITEYDPCYKVVYLGNVLTGIAKGMYCIISSWFSNDFGYSFSHNWVSSLFTFTWVMTYDSHALRVSKAIRTCSTGMDRKLVHRRPEAFIKSYFLSKQN